MKKNKKRLKGYVVSDKPDKSIVVKVRSSKIHSLYKKRMNWSKKYLVHDEKNEAKEGNYVEILESKAYSKKKKFNLSMIIKNENDSK